MCETAAIEEGGEEGERAQKGRVESISTTPSLLSLLSPDLAVSRRSRVEAQCGMAPGELRAGLGPGRSARRIIKVKDVDLF